MRKSSFTFLSKFLFTIIIIGAIGTISGQAVQGTVKTDTGLPVPYANIFIEGTTTGTNSDADGNFLFDTSLEGQRTLTISVIGYGTVRRSIDLTGSDINVDIILRSSEQNLDEVIVTAGRSREFLDEVPSSVAIINQQKLQSLSQTSTIISDVFNEVPGFALSTNTQSNRGQTLRGRNLLVLIDGIPQSTPLRNGSRDINTIDPNVIERIEIIKGATAIYGNGADGGIVNYITKKPTGKKFEAVTELNSTGALTGLEHSIGTGLSQQFSGNSDKFSYILSGQYQQSGVFRDADGAIISPDQGLGETQIYNLFGKARYAIDPKNRIEFMYNFFANRQDTEYIGFGGVYGESKAIGVIGLNVGEDIGTRQNHNAQLTYESNEIIGKTDLFVNVYRQDFETVFGFSPFFTNPETGFEGGQSRIISSKQGLRFNVRSPWEINDATSVDFLYGIDVLNDVTEQSLVDGRGWVPETDMTNIAPFLQLNAATGDLIIKAGIRFENIGIAIPDYTTIFIFPNGADTPTGNVAVAGGELEYGATTFNMGIRYNRYPEFKPFASFSQSFSLADLGRTLRTATESTVSQISSEAIIANNYELGFNSRSGKVNVSAAGFLSTSDLGSTFREVNGIFEISRQPERIYGVETVVDVFLSDTFSVGGSLAYTEGKFDNEDDFGTFLGGDRIPPFKGTAHLSYRSDGKWDARLAGIYSGNRDRFDPDESGNFGFGTGPVNDFVLLNLTGNYHVSQNASIGLGIENLLNTDYFTPLAQWNGRDDTYLKGNGVRCNLSIKLRY